MYMVGIDVAKNSFVYAVLDDSRRLVRAPQQIINAQPEIDAWLIELRRCYGERLELCLESTGSYHRLLIVTALHQRVPCRLLNPLMTKQFTRATVRGTKTDRKDALVIARLGLQQAGHLVSSDHLHPAKQLLRLSRKLCQVKTAIGRLQIVAGMLIEELPPDCAESFTDITQSLQIARMNFQRAGLAHINHDTQELLMSIPGIGPVVAAVTIAEMGSVKRFKNAGALVAFCGLDPRVRQSGTSLHRNTKLTKRGSPYLRHMLYIAAHMARQKDPALAAYFQKKRDQGRPYTEALMPVARRIVHRIYAVWKRGTPYEPRQTT